MSQSSSAAAPPQAQPPAAAPPQGGGGDAAVDARIDKIEKTQEQQGQLLEKIAAAVTGGGGAAAPAGAPPDGGAAQPQGLAQLVRKEIADADQRRKTEETDEQWRQGVNEVVEKVKREGQPRDPEQGLRGRLQRHLFGAPELWAGWSAPTSGTTRRGGCPT